MTRRAARGSVLAALPAIAAVALASAGAQAAAYPDDRSTYKATAAECGDERPIFVTRPGPWNYCRNLYMARVALDGRKQPTASKKGAKDNYLKAGEWVGIRCQVYEYDKGTGEQLELYDKVGDVFVPDKYMRTRFTGRIPGAPVCDPQPDGSWRP